MVRDSKIIGTVTGLLTRHTSIAGQTRAQATARNIARHTPRIRPQMILTQLIIGAIAAEIIRMCAGIRLRRIRIEMFAGEIATRMIARRIMTAGMRRQIAGGRNK